MAQKKTKKSKAETDFEDKKSDEKIVEAQVVEAEESTSEPEVTTQDAIEKATGKSLVFYFAAFLVIVSAFGFLGYKFLLGANRDLQNLDAKIDESELVVLQQVKDDATIIEQSDMQYGDVAEEAAEIVGNVVENASEVALDAADDLAETLQEKEVITPAPVPQEAKIYKADSKATDVLRRQVASQNQHILLFLSAQNLQKSLSANAKKIDEKSLRNELKFFEEISQGKAGYAGKIQILEYSLDGGVPSIAELSADLDVIVKKLEAAEQKSFWENFKDSIFGLVKVTKLDADVDGKDGNYAKILLAKKALQNQDFNGAIALMEKISDARTQEWKDKAYKLQRMHETVEYLLDATRQSLLESYRIGVFETAQ